VKNIFLTPAANRDMAEIWLYTANQWGADQADAYTRQIEEILRHARKFPDIGNQAMGLPTQYRKLRSGSHRIIYRQTDTELIIVRILHERQDVPDDIEDF